MRNRIFLAFGIASLLLSITAVQAAIVREWDPVKNRWVTYDTKAQKFFQGTSKSAIDREFVKYSGAYGPKTIVINTEERRLYFVYEPGKAIKYGIGVGREGFTWQGTDYVSMKAEWPGWTPPPEMIKREKANGRILPGHMPGGLNNPLGARALYIGSRIYRIHGSNEPWTIGHAVSSGCIRMTNDDIIDLYNRVPVGTKVVVMMSGSGSSVVDKDATDNPPPVLADPVGTRKALVKAPLPLKAPPKAVISVNAPADAVATPARKAPPVVVAKKAAPPAADKTPVDTAIATASIEPASAPAQPKPTASRKIIGDSLVGGDRGMPFAAAVKSVAAMEIKSSVIGDRLVGSSR